MSSEARKREEAITITSSKIRCKAGDSKARREMLPMAKWFTLATSRGLASVGTKRSSSEARESEETDTTGERSHKGGGPAPPALFKGFCHVIAPFIPLTAFFKESRHRDWSHWLVSLLMNTGYGVFFKVNCSET